MAKTIKIDPTSTPTLKNPNRSLPKDPNIITIQHSSISTLPLHPYPLQMLYNTSTIMAKPVIILSENKTSFNNNSTSKKLQIINCIFARGVMFVICVAIGEGNAD